MCKALIVLYSIGRKKGPKCNQAEIIRVSHGNTVLEHSNIIWRERCVVKEEDSGQISHES